MLQASTHYCCEQSKSSSPQAVTLRALGFRSLRMDSWEYDADYKNEKGTQSIKTLLHSLMPNGKTSDEGYKRIGPDAGKWEHGNKITAAVVEASPIYIWLKQSQAL